jgi:hypothetical protein
VSDIDPPRMLDLSRWSSLEDALAYLEHQTSWMLEPFNCVADVLMREREADLT